MAKGSILHVVTTVEMGGIEILVRDLAAQQRKAGYTVNVCCSSGHGGVLESDFATLGVGVYCASAYRGRWSLPRVMASIWGILRHVRPNIVHIHTESVFAIIPALMARLQGTPSLVRSLHLCVPGGTDGWLRRRWRRLEMTGCVWLGVRIVGVSSDVRHDESRRVGIPEEWITVIDNGIDTERFGAEGRGHLALTTLIGREAPRERMFLMLCVARLQPQKNHALLVRATADLLRRDCPREPHLLLAGVGELEADLRRLSRELGVNDYVHFLGLRRDVPDLLAETDVFVMSSDFEGFGISVAEAMSAGKPVIATDVPGFKSVVAHGQTGLLIAPGDPHRFADALESLLRDPALGRTMGQAARARAVANYSLEACARAYEALYEHR